MGSAEYFAENLQGVGKNISVTMSEFCSSKSGDRKLSIHHFEEFRYHKSATELNYLPKIVLELFMSAFSRLIESTSPSKDSSVPGFRDQVGPQS